MSKYLTRRACDRCREKKKRCDGVRPSCSMCELFKVYCVYPDVPSRAFVVYKETSKQVSGSSCADEYPRLHLYYDRRFSCTSTDAYLADTFWSAYLPSCHVDKSSVAGTFSVARYLAGLRIVTENYGLSRMARTACALVVLGRRYSDGGLQQYAIEAYGKCLRGISHCIAQSNARPVQLPALAAACRLMSLYEMMRSPELGTEGPSQGTDWRAHARATCGLLQNIPNSLSEQAQEEADMRRELAHMRTWVNFSARQPEFFNQQSFSPKVSADALPYIDCFAHLQTLMQNVPGLFATSDALTLESPHQREKVTTYMMAQKLVKALLELGQDFKDWELQTQNEMKQQSSINPELAGMRMSPERNFMQDNWLLQSAGNGPGILLAMNEQWASRAAVQFQAMRVACKVQHKFGLTISLPDGLPDDILYCLRCITTSASKLMSAKAGLWVSEQSMFPISVAVHTMAGLGVSEDDPHRSTLMKDLKAMASGEAAFTYAFFKSHANDCCSELNRGNMDDPIEHQRMAFGFYG